MLVRRGADAGCLSYRVSSATSAPDEDDYGTPTPSDARSRPPSLILFSLDDGVTRCCERCCKSVTSRKEAYLWRWLLDPSVRGMACRISHSESCYCYRARAWRLAAWPPRANRQLFGCFAVRVRMWCHRNLTTRAFPLARTSPAPGRTLRSNLLFADFLSVTFGRKASHLTNR
jgi:hypothetical protein